MLTRLINLDRTPDRLTAFQQDNPLFADMKRMPAVDGLTIDRAELIAGGILSQNLNYTDGAVGCALSHIAIWTAALESGHPVTAVEDDAIINIGFQSEYDRLLPTLPEDWELILWGFNTDSFVTLDIMPGVTQCIAALDQPSILKNAKVFRDTLRETRLYRLVKTFGTICYTVSPRGAQRLLNYAIPLRPLDVFYPGLNKTLPNTGIDNVMGSLYAKMNAYVAMPPLVVPKNDVVNSTVQPAASRLGGQRLPDSMKNGMIAPAVTDAKPNLAETVEQLTQMAGVDYADSAVLARLDAAPAQPLAKSTDNTTLPKILHFVFGMQRDAGGKPFSFVHYMAIKSAHDTHPGHRLIFWHSYEPEGPYWEAAKGMVELARVDAPDLIFGRPVEHFAHKADVVRMAVLCRFGGIYLDLDTICVRSLAPLFTGLPVLGQELEDSSVARPIKGLCNAVMLTPPNSVFFKAWWESYRSFDGRDWSQHSVSVPQALATENPDLVKIMKPGAFFEPTWDAAGLRDLFYNDIQYPDAYCHHLWESKSWVDVSRMNEDSITGADTTYNRIARRYIDATEYARLKKIKADHIASGAARLNLGSGPAYMAGWTNVDMFASSFPDVVADLERDRWPFEDNSISEVRAHHILEHIGEGFQFFMQEMYRVCKDGAKVSIEVPHPRHDWFLTDPTHVRRFLPETFQMLDAELCRSWLANGDSKTPIALYWNIDFKIEKINQALDQSVAAAMQKMNIPIDSDTIRMYSNLISLVNAQMSVRKQKAASAKKPEKSLPQAPEKSLPVSAGLISEERVARDSSLRMGRFSAVYREKAWGEKKAEFYSGPGSDPEKIPEYIQIMAEFINANNIRTVHDIGCGDFQVGACIAERCPNTQFLGIDIVPELIANNIERYAALRNVQFQVGDIVAAPVGTADLAMIRQVLQHLSNESVLLAMKHMSGYAAVMISNHDACRDLSVNADIEDGAGIRKGRLDLSLPPFNINIHPVARLKVRDHEGFLDMSLLENLPAIPA